MTQPLDLAQKAFIQSVHQASLPGIWSKGVSLARHGSVVADLRANMEPGELRFRVKSLDRPLSARVQLWPEEEDYFCDCGSKVEPCEHVAGACILLQGEATTDGASIEARPETQQGSVGYRLTRDGAQGLRLTREIIYPGRAEGSHPLRESLIARVGGIQSGRIKAPAILASTHDFAVDEAWSKMGASTHLDGGQIRNILESLRECSDITLDGLTVRIEAHTPPIKTEIVDESSGFLVRRENRPDLTESHEVFVGGIELRNGVLRPQADFFMNPRVSELLSGRGSFFPKDRVEELVIDVVPLLLRDTQLEIRSRKIPERVEAEPRVLIRLREEAPDTLIAVAEIVYGDPPIARLSGQQWTRIDPTKITRRRPELERACLRKLQARLHLAIGQVARLPGARGVEFRRKLEGWDIDAGSAQNSFLSTARLLPQINVSEAGFDLAFHAIEENAPQGLLSSAKRADVDRVFDAWKNQSGFVQLIDGDWAELPLDWLEKNGPRLQELLRSQQDLKRKGRALPQVLLPELMELAHETDSKIPEKLRNLADALINPERLTAKIPTTLKADLRHYQKAGVAWLQTLRDSGLGAMLADDMGLGKTLQALCAIKGRTLVVAPTSVLVAWREQVAKFRPDLKFSTYVGPARKIETDADITLTTYSILRLDRALLTPIEWDTVVLDETQNIKNPESQTAQAAFDLKASFRIALSGTPIENRIEDLWSQFRYTNPGLLGPRDEIRERPVEEIRKRVRPFILRRLKQEVAPELPSRTEVVLRCELSSEERALYQSIWAATQSEIVAKLNVAQSKNSTIRLDEDADKESADGPRTLDILAALLRLRQACCHPSLLPNQQAASSSKVDLLVDHLEESIGLGHRALVFSQWTGLLDLIEEPLRSSQISFGRLDGSTRDREKVVREFQSENGPPVMLISLKAGGSGLTLTRADHVYIVDPWWNPAVEDQAADRAHRIGQVNPVLVHRLVAQDTIEERVLQLQARKRELAASVLAQGSAALSLTADDIRELLS